MNKGGTTLTRPLRVLFLLKGDHMPNYQNQRGTYDAYDGDALNIEKLRDILSQIVATYGYNPIHTPIYEQTELFARSAGESSDIVTKEMFSFVDKGGRNITLRPEITAGVIRAIVNNKLYATKDLPLKYYYYGPAFRYERPSAGRYRQFNQFGVECIGVNSYLNDVECISLGYNTLTNIGFDKVILKINTLGDEASRQAYQIALREYFADKLTSMCPDCRRRYEQNVLRILDCKVIEDQEIIKNAPKMSDFINGESKAYFNKVLELLDEQQIPYVIDETLVRGLDYYSHVVFEYHYIREDGTSLGAIGAGGHYDHLVKEVGGPELSSVGFALGIERLNTLLKEIHPESYEQTNLDIFIIHMGEETLTHAFLLMQDLRENGFSVDMTFENKGLGAQFKIAGRKNAKFALIIGENEMQTYEYPVKCLSTAIQENVTYDNLATYLEEHLIEEELK